MERSTKVLACVWMMGFLVTFSGSATDFMFPKIELAGHHRQATRLAVTWVPVVYYAALAGSLMLFGGLADRWSKKGVLRVGLLLSCCGAIGASMSPSVTALSFWRAFSGMGAAALSAVGPPLIVNAYRDTAKRQRAFGVTATGVAAGLLIAPLVAGAMTDWFQWRAVYVINACLAAFVMCISGFLSGFLREPKAARVVGGSNRFDIEGALASVVTIVALTVFIKTAPLLLREPGVPTLSFTIASAGGAMLWRSNRRETVPLINLRVLLYNWRIRLTWLIQVLSFTSAYIIVYSLPFLGLYEMEISLLELAVAVSIFPAGFMLGAPVGGVCGARFGSIPVIVMSAGASLIVSLVYAALQYIGGAALALISILTFLSGFSRGLFVAPYTNLVMAELPGHMLAAGGGMIGLTRTLGTTIGASMGAAIFAFNSVVMPRWVGAITTMPDATVERLVHISAIRMAYTAALLVSTLNFGATLFLLYASRSGTEGKGDNV